MQETVLKVLTLLIQELSRRKAYSIQVLNICRITKQMVLINIDKYIL